VKKTKTKKEHEQRQGRIRMGVRKAVRNVSHCGMYARKCVLAFGMLICVFTPSAECSEERKKAGEGRMKHAMNATCANQAGESDAGAILAAIWREPDNLNPLLRTGSSMQSVFTCFAARARRRQWRRCVHCHDVPLIKCVVRFPCLMSHMLYFNVVGSSFFCVYLDNEIS
jgi:hypothetical protein